MKKIVLVLSIVFLILSGCKKEVEKVYPEFIGEWVCTDGQNYKFTITIDENSKAVYTERLYEHASPIERHGIARANDKKLKIGRLISFKIIEYPHKIDTALSNKVVLFDYPIIKKANWKMTLGSPKFYVGGGTYYKADY